MSYLSTVSPIHIGGIMPNHEDLIVSTVLIVFLLILLYSKHTHYNEKCIQDPRWNDVNVISSLLKLFFRKLPDALLTSELYPLFIEADKIEDPGKRVITIKKLVRDRYVLELLKAYNAFEFVATRPKSPVR
jgi:hypothetical protein